MNGFMVSPSANRRELDRGAKLPWTLRLLHPGRIGAFTRLLPNISDCQAHEQTRRQDGGGTLTHKRRSSGQPSCTFRVASSSGFPHPGQTTPAVAIQVLISQPGRQPGIPGLFHVERVIGEQLSRLFQPGSPEPGLTRPVGSKWSTLKNLDIDYFEADRPRKARFRAPRLEEAAELLTDDAFDVEETWDPAVCG